MENYKAAENVTAIADKVGYWAVWDECEKVGGRYVDNLEMHFCQAQNAAFKGMAIEDIPQKVFGFTEGDTLEDVFLCVMNQAQEDAANKAFDW